MKQSRSVNILYWATQFICLAVSIPFMAWLLSQTSRGAFLTPSFSYILQILLFWTPFSKALSLISLFLLVNSSAWARMGRIVRVIVFALLDVVCSVISLVVLMPYWLSYLFIDASYTAWMTLFPYALVVGMILAWRTPVQARRQTPAADAAPAGEQEREPAAPLSDQLIPGILVLSALMLSLALASTIAGHDAELAGMSLALVPFMLIFSRLYLAPAFLAQKRIPRQAGRILLVTILLGWTLVGWLVCLAWARLPAATMAPARVSRNWRYFAGWLLSGLALVITGISIAVLGESMAVSAGLPSAMGIGVTVVILCCSVLACIAGGRLILKGTSTA